MSGLGLRSERVFPTRSELPKRYPVWVATFAVDPPNLGGIARTAEAFGARGVIARSQPNKAAMGAARWLWTASVPDPAEIVASLAAQGWPVVVLEQTPRSLPLWDVVLPERMVLVTGHESQGVPDEIIATVPLAVEIPQSGYTRCLNVASATSIALYEWLRQHGANA